MRPRYWQDEESGVLEPVVRKYLESDEDLDDYELLVMREYLRQWICSPVWDGNPYADCEAERNLAGLRSSIDHIASRAILDDWLDRSLDLGIDPL